MIKTTINTQTGKPEYRVANQPSEADQLRAEVARLTAENQQAKEAIATLNAGRPLGDVVGLHTAQNALAEVARLTAELAELREQKPAFFALDGALYKTMQFHFDGGIWEGQVPLYARPIPAAQAVPEGLAASFDDAVEAARLLGGTQAKKGFGVYTEQDSRFERSMYESIAKHRRAMLAAAPQPPAEHVPAATPSEDAKDAARYRWIVGEHDVDLPVVRCSWKRHSDRKGGEWVNLIDGEDMTEHIDAAMQKGGA